MAHQALSLGASAPALPKPNILKTTVESVRAHAGGYSLDVVSGDCGFGAALPPGHAPEPGDRLIFSYPPGANHFEHDATGYRLERDGVLISQFPEPVKEQSMNTLIAINPATIGGETVQTVNARELHAFLEVKKDFSDWIKAQLELFVQGVDYAVFNHNEYANIFPQKGENSQPCEARGRKPVEYALTIECAKHISMMSRTEKGKQARNYFIACERQVKAGVSSLPKNLTEALRLAADLNEQKELAEARALEAERTKAWIGSNREATAMATASAAVREKKRLEIELDHSKEYATVKRMEMLYHGQKFNWRLLKSTAIEMGIPSMDIFDQNYGTVKAYHADVWREAYALEIPAAPSNDDLAENAA